jgi:competence protein ComEA
LKIGKEQLGWLVAIPLLGIALIGLVLGLLNRPQPAPIEIIPALPTTTDLPTATSLPTVTPGPLRVYVSGAVLVPEVYTLPAGSIARDAVNMAGGFTADAVREAVNLAQILQDGMHIHVPAVGEEALAPAVRGETISVPAGLDGLININVATQAELEQLPGIGPSLAQEIIDYRQAHGPFTAVDEILNVSGIGPVKFEQIKDLITVD